MRYRPETFALYNALFTEAHQTLVKEARVGMFARLGQRLKAMGEAWRASSPEAIRARQLMEQQSAHQTQIDRMVGALSEADVARAQAELARQQVATQHRSLQQQHEALQAARKAEQDLVAQEMQQYQAKPGALTSAQRWRNLGLAGTGIGLAGIPAAYYAGRTGAEQQGRTARNLAFGAGAAAGLAAPQLVSGLGAIANTAGQMGLFPELQGMNLPSGNPQGSY